MKITIYRIFFFFFCILLGAYSAVQIMEAEPMAGAYGAFFGLFSFVTVLFVERLIQKSSPSALLGGGVGLVAAIIVTLILRWALALENMPVAVHVGMLAVCSHLGYMVGARAVRVLNLSNTVTGLTAAMTPKILDTSAIIDGRVVDMVELGFLGGPFIVPLFVLNEVQGIADSTDPLKRARGRRGLSMLENLQGIEGVEVRIIEEDFSKIKEVDGKLVALARDKNGMLVTTDFNLSKVAELQGIRVLNIHQLSQAVRPVVLPGEVVKVTIQKNGKEAGQGVGYLDDGTMVVVENGMNRLNEAVETVVTSVLHTAAGRMIFSRVPGEVDTPPQPKERRRVWRTKG